MMTPVSFSDASMVLSVSLLTSVDNGGGVANDVDDKDNDEDTEDVDDADTREEGEDVAIERALRKWLFFAFMASRKARPVGTCIKVNAREKP